MGYYAELDYENRETEQKQMEEDPYYTAWLNQLDKTFALETETWYNNSIDNLQENT